ncbi:MAG: hypothetical protein WKF82_10550 [Nocardioidaceae bacterium]
MDLVDLAVKASEAMIAAGRPHRAAALVQDIDSQLPKEAPTLDRGRLLHALAAASLLIDGFIDALEVTTEALGLVAAESPLRAPGAQCSRAGQRLPTA